MEGDKHYAGKISGAVLRRNLKAYPKEGSWNAKDSWFSNEEDYSVTAVFKADNTISHFELKPEGE